MAEGRTRSASLAAWRSRNALKRYRRCSGAGRTDSGIREVGGGRLATIPGKGRWADEKKRWPTAARVSSCFDHHIAIPTALILGQ